MKYVVNQLFGLISFVVRQALIHTRSWDETDWTIVMFCAFVFGCFSINNCTSRKRL